MWCLRFHPAERELIRARYRFNLNLCLLLHVRTTSRAKAKATTAANATTAALKTVPESQIMTILSNLKQFQAG
jgi:hypothetical protein